MTDTRPCPICGPAPSRRLFTGRDTFMLIPGEHDVVRCETCGLWFVHPRPSPEEMARYYPDHYWGRAEEAPGMEPASLRIRDLLAREFPGGRVLDVGCGTANKTAGLREAGLDVVGLDPYEEACRIAREHHGLDIVCASLRGAALPEASFDAVTMFDVLEHLDDPLGDLREAHRLLKPGGLVCVKVPNIAALQARLLGRHWFAVDVPRHLQDFSPASLRYALRAAGLAQAHCRAAPVIAWGAFLFEMSIVMWLRARHLDRTGAQVAPTEGENLGEALEGKVYGGVSGRAKRAFRWLLRNVLYAPLAVENIIGRSATLIGVGRK